MQAEAGKAEIDRQRPLDLVLPVVEKLPLVGDRRRHAVADDVDRHGALIQEAEVEELHPERPAAAAEKRAIRPEADVPVGVEIQPVERLGQGRGGLLEGHGGKLARPPHDILEAERVHRRGGILLGERRRGGGHEEALQQPTAGKVGHVDRAVLVGRRRGWAKHGAVRSERLACGLIPSTRGG